MTRQWYTVSQVADLLGASEGTIRALIREDYIKAIRLGSGKSSYRIHQSEIERFTNGEKELPSEEDGDE